MHASLLSVQRKSAVITAGIPLQQPGQRLRRIRLHLRADRNAPARGLKALPFRSYSGAFSLPPGCPLFCGKDFSVGPAFLKA